jgi:hypothetical protein
MIPEVEELAGRMKLSEWSKERLGVLDIGSP